MNPTARSLPSLLWRIIAGAGAALVFVLTLAAVSPTVHGWLHGHADEEWSGCAHEHESDPRSDEADHECAVTLFGHGVEALVGFCLLMLARPLVRSIAWRAGDAIFAARPRYWLVPSHAPPVA